MNIYFITFKSTVPIICVTGSVAVYHEPRGMQKKWDVITEFLNSGSVNFAGRLSCETA